MSVNYIAGFATVGCSADGGREGTQYENLVKIVTVMVVQFTWLIINNCVHSGGKKSKANKKKIARPSK